jgi:hypothetical protein
LVCNDFFAKSTRLLGSIGDFTLQNRILAKALAFAALNAEESSFASTFPNVDEASQVKCAMTQIESMPIILYRNLSRTLEAYLSLQFELQNQYPLICDCQHSFAFTPAVQTEPNENASSVSLPVSNIFLFDVSIYWIVKVKLLPGQQRLIMLLPVTMKETSTSLSSNIFLKTLLGENELLSLTRAKGKVGDSSCLSSGLMFLQELDFFNDGAAVSYTLRYADKFCILIENRGKRKMGYRAHLKSKSYAYKRNSGDFTISVSISPSLHFLHS